MELSDFEYFLAKNGHFKAYALALLSRNWVKRLKKGLQHIEKEGPLGVLGGVSEVRLAGITGKKPAK